MKLVPILMALLAVLEAGCAGVRYPRTYVLDLDAPAAAAAPARPARAGTVAVRDFAYADYLGDGRIVYRPTRTEVAYYEYHRWAMSLRRMITDSFAGRLRGMAAFTRVDALRSANTDYVLTGAIERLEEVDDGREVQAVVELSAQLVDTRTQKTVWQHAEAASEPVRKRDVPGVVSSLSAATTRAIEALIASLENDVARGATYGGTK
jgi:ABC-type uncharacterized transport system auxiliary subunit